MLKERTELEDLLIPEIEQIKTNKKRVGIVKKSFAKYDLHEAEIQKYFSFPEEIRSTDLRVLCLLTKALFDETKNYQIDPKFFFTDKEMVESQQYSASLERGDKLEFPLTLANATIVGHESYMVTMSVQSIKRMLDNKLLHYNYDIQREAVVKKRENKIIIEPTLNIKNVKEISQHLIDNTLVPTVLVFNAATRSSDTGEELTYDAKRMELTINSNTRLDILDGFHRVTSLSKTLEMYPDIQFNFAVMITNYSTTKARSYQAQISKATPLSKVRVMELENKRYSDTVVSQLREESDLKGRISQTGRIHTTADELVSYNVLADTIDEVFSMNTKIDALDVADYLTDFFNYLLGSFQEEFIINQQEFRKRSIINDNNMFAGYIVLARRMQENNYKLNKIKEILTEINFDRDNPLWEELEILDKGAITNTNKTRRNLINYFKQIPIKKIE